MWLAVEESLFCGSDTLHPGAARTLYITFGPSAMARILKMNLPVQIGGGGGRLLPKNKKTKLIH